MLQTGHDGAAVRGLAVFGWDDCLRHAAPLCAERGLETATAALVYTCGASGKPRAAMLSHRGLLACAARLGERLGGPAQQCSLSLLPLSAAPALALLASALACTGTTLLVNQVLARDLPTLVAHEGVTAASAPPWLWMQVAALDWSAAQGLRAITSAGGTLPRPTLDALRKRLPQAQVLLMHERRADQSAAGESLVPHPGAGAEQLATTI